MRARTFMIMIYPDDVNFIEYLENIVSKYDKYAYITHNKDIEDGTGEIKKCHMHVVLYFKNKKELSELAKEIGIAENYIKVWDSKIKAIRYLVHADNNDKYQYSAEEVIGTLKSDLVRSLNDGYEVMVITEILEFIDTTPQLSYRGLTKWVLQKGYYAEFRRSQGIIREYLK